VLPCLLPVSGGHPALLPVAVLEGTTRVHMLLVCWLLLCVVLLLLVDCYYLWCYYCFSIC
jgi:hypothetical protein